MLSDSSKLKAFISVCVPLAIAKFWQETVYLMSYFFEADLKIPATTILTTAKYQPLGVAAGYIATAVFVDRIGIKKMLSIGLLMMSAVVLLFSQVNNFEMLYIYRFSLGFFIGLIYNCSFGALSIIFDQHELPKKTSVLYMFAFGSTIVSPMLLTTTQVFFSWRILLLQVMALTAITSLAVWKFFPQKITNIDVKTYFKQCKSLCKNKIFLLMCIVSTLCMGGFYGFVCIFAHNLNIMNVSTEVSKFIITDMQFISRIFLFMVTTWSGYKLTQQTIPMYLKYCLFGMAIVGAELFYMLLTSGTLFASNAVFSQILEQASQSKHVFSLLLSSFSGVWFFWLYAAIMGIAQPANKSKALSIAGKDMGGSAQAILGFSLSIGEFIFASAAQSHWPIGAAGFFIFVISSACIVILGLKKLIK